MLPVGDVNPRERFPVVTVLFILINILVFIYQLTLPRPQLNQFIRSAAVVPAEVVQNPGLTSLQRIITSTFLHGGLLHIGSNMLYLWIFGDNVEDAMSHLGYGFFYLLAGIVAAIAQIMVNPASTIPMLGASGAVAGVLGFYAVMYPRARVRTLIFIIIFITFVNLPALLVLGFWFVLQLFQGVAAISAEAAGGVAWFAHIGGFALGMLVGFGFRISGKPINRGYR
jgi:membrane associated rhomboid family serine protease